MVWWKISRPLTKSWRLGVKSWRFLCHSPPEDVWGPLSRQGEFGCAWDNARVRRSYHEVTHSHPWAVLQHPKRSPNTWGMAFINCPQAYLHDMCWTRFLLDVTVSLSLVNVYVIDTHLRTFHAEMYLKDFGGHFVDRSDHFALQNRYQSVCWLDVRCRESFGRLGRRAETAGHGLQNLQTCKREWMEQAQQYPILISALSIVLDY